MIFKRSKSRFYLKGKKAGEDKWEILEEYDEKKNFSELRDIIADYREEGYIAFRFEEYDKNGKFKKMWWYKSYERKKDRERRIPEDLEELLGFVRRLKEELEKLSGESRSAVDLLAEVVAFEELKRKLLSVLNIQPQPQKSSDISEFIQLIQMLQQMRPIVQQAQIPQQQIPQTTPQTTVKTEVKTEGLKTEFKSLSRSLREEADRILDSVLEEISESIKPCKGEEECL